MPVEVEVESELMPADSELPLVEVEVDKELMPVEVDVESEVTPVDSEVTLL